MNVHIGFTGTRDGMTTYQRHCLEVVLWAHKHAESFHHGDCVGADAQAHALAREVHIPCHVHPPLVSRYRAWCVGGVRYPPCAYRARNQAIVQACTLLIAAPKTLEETAHSGTWMTIRFARHCGKAVVILPRVPETS
jgi:hypothetical protein